MQFKTTPIFLLLLFVLFGTTAAQTPEVHFKRLNTAHGLSSDNVFAIYRDHYGFMWFGTDVGLNKYDGVNFTVYRYDVANPRSLGNNRIKAIIEDREHNLWIATFGGGISLYDRKQDEFTVIKNNGEDLNSLSNDYVNTIFEDSRQDLWIGTINGLNKYNRKTKKFTRYHHDPANPASIASNSVSSIFEDSKGNFWVGTSSGLNLMDRKTGQVKRYTKQSDNDRSISHNYITKITEDKAGNLWVGTRWDGLNRFDHRTQTFTQYRSNGANPASLGDDQILDIFPVRKGDLWIGTNNGGLSFFEAKNGSFRRFVADDSDRNSLTNGAISAVYEDNSGTLWVGTGEGICYYNPLQQKFQLFKHKYNKNSISGNNIKSLCEDREGNIWIAVDGGGLNLYNRKANKFQAFMPNAADSNSISNQFIHTVMQDSRGDLWIGTYEGGLNRYDIKNNKFSLYKHNAADSSSLSSNSVKSIIEDKQGNLWIGTNGGGINRYNRATDNFTRFPCGHGALNCWVNRLIEDRSGNIWISTNWGLSLLDPKTSTFTHFLHDAQNPQSISSNDVYSTYEDKKGRIWVATKYGLNLFNPQSKTFRAYKKEDGLPSNTVMSINEDSKGNLWLGTLQGLSAFNPEQKTFKNYSVSVGLQGDEFSVGATYKTRSGELLFGGTAGFNLFHPDSLKDNTFKPPVYLTGFSIFNKPITVGKDSILSSHIHAEKDITLSYRESVFSFEYAALNFIDGKHNQYAYMMEGFDKDWHYVGTEKKATYTNLEPGEYRFRVKASNNDGLWNEEGTALGIIITPPYWKTWWFRSLVVLSVIGSAISFYRVRMNAIKAQKELLEQKVKEQTADIRKANDELVERQEEILQQQEEISMQRDHLVIVNEQVMSSIRYAKTIQTAILPAPQSLAEAFPEHFVLYRPKDVVSGDFYWFAHLSKEESGRQADLTFVAAVDCTGHGVPGAFMSIIGNTILNEIVKQKLVTSPAEILELLDLGVKKAVEKAEGINTAGMDVCLCQLEKREGGALKVVYSGAKRDLLYVAPDSTTVEKLSADRRSIGSKISSVFTNQELVLEKGSMLYLTTDGYADQNNADREKLGTRVFNEIIGRYCVLSAQEQKAALEKVLDEHQQGTEQRDDITVLGIRA